MCKEEIKTSINEYIYKLHILIDEEENEYIKVKLIELYTKLLQNKISIKDAAVKIKELNKLKSDIRLLSAAIDEYGRNTH